MKTTINISDDLFVAVKKTAAEKRTTVTQLIAEALRLYLQPRKERRKQFKLADGAFKGGTGLQPGLDPTDWARIRDLIYEGRGA